MLRDTAWQFIQFTVDYLFAKIEDVDEYDNFVHPGPLDLKRLGRFAAGHEQ